MSPETDRGKEFSISVVDPEQIKVLFSLAESLPQKRATLTLYRNPDEKADMVINAILPGSYIRPYKDINPSQTETFSQLSGTAQLVTFNDEGETAQKVLLTRGMLAVVDANAWHTLIALTPFAVFEVRVHPAGYDREKNKVFAPWAPEEGSKEAAILSVIERLTSYS